MTGRADPGWLSNRAVRWALYSAEGVPAHLVSTLVAVAARTGEDGRGAFPSVAAIASATRKAERTVQQDLADLRGLGLLLPGDASLAKHIRADRRPSVYDLPMPRGEPDDTPYASPRSGHGVRQGGERGAADSAHGVRQAAPEQDKNKTGTRRGPRAAPHAPPPERAAAHAPTAQTILGGFIDWDRARGGQLTRQTIGQLARQIGKLVAEGIDATHIKRGLTDWRERGQHPSTLHSFVDAAMAGRAAAPRPPGRRNGGGIDWDAAMARARARDAAEARGELPRRGELQ